MKKYFNEEFISKCKNDIDSLCEEVTSVMPVLEDWQLEGSVIFDDDKKIVCKTVVNEKEEIVGYNININYLDESNNYVFETSDNSISLSKNYSLNGKLICEKFGVSMTSDSIVRGCTYLVDGDSIFYEEVYNLDTGCMKVISNYKYDGDFSYKNFDEMLSDAKDIYAQRRGFVRKRGN